MTVTAEDQACTYCGEDDGGNGVLSSGEGGELVCEDCAVSCEHCGATVAENDAIEVMGGEFWCDYCVSDQLRRCDDCGEYTDDWYVCDHSLSLGRVEYEVCLPCYQEEHSSCGNDSVIHDYSYKPTPQFIGKGPRFFGVELEIDGGGEDPENASTILEHSKGEALFYIKSDSSLSDGMEIVTHPASVDYQLHRMPWDDIAQTARELGYKSHDAGTCGLHVHVSRAALGRTRAAQELTISKLIVLLWRHWEPLFKFSRRDSPRWCHQQYSFETLSKAGLDDAKTKGHSTALNVSNRDTVEFRMFRGSLNIQTLKAAISMVNVLVNIALSRGILWVYKSSWKQILTECKADRNLWLYLTHRNLT